MRVVLIFMSILSLQVFADDLPVMKEGVLKAIEKFQNNQAQESSLQEYHMDLEPLAEKNDPIAQFLLAPKYLTTNHVRAEKLLFESASSGCAGAAMMLGIAYQRQNRMDESAEWVLKAAKKGEYAAQQFIGVSKWKGRFNFEENKIEAYGWLRLAEAQAYKKYLWSQIIEMVVQLEIELGSDFPEALNYYETLKVDVPLVDYHPCGQIMPGIDRDFDEFNYNNFKKY